MTFKTVMDKSVSFAVFSIKRRGGKLLRETKANGVTTLEYIFKHRRVTIIEGVQGVTVKYGTTVLTNEAITV